MEKDRPRIFGIPATRSDDVAILRRGPSDWFHIGRWDARAHRYSPGAWLRGKLFPERCDLSPDGRWFAYMAFQGQNSGELGESYLAISRLPWLTALAGWRLDSTYSRGFHFVEQRGVWNGPSPTVGDDRPARKRYGLEQTRPAQFAVERRRGWIECADSPPRNEKDMWDERREARMEKRQPAARGPLTLEVSGHYAAFRDGPPGAIEYAVRGDGDILPLDDVQWAEWSASGELMVATRGGALQQWRCDSLKERALLAEVDLSELEPEPTPPPAWARDW